MRTIRALTQASRSRAPTPFYRSGFTVVELLIVIVVIAILAVITIVAYNGITQRANASAANHGLAQAKKKLELYKVDNGTYPTTSNLASAGVTDSTVAYQYTSDGTSYCMTGTSGNVSYKATEISSPASGGCAGHGVGGVSAVTNLATSPRATALDVASGPTWLSSRWGGAYGSYSLLTGQVAPSGTDITTAVRYTTLTGGGGRGFHIAGNPEGTTPGAEPFARFPVSPGDTYTFSCWMRVSQSGLSVGLRLRPAIDTVTWLSGGVGGTIISANAGEWTRITQTYTVPAGAAALSVYAITMSGTLSVGTTVDGTGLMIVKGSTSSNYADGSTLNWVWNGTANASSSTGPPA